jgi:hypothetical protein
LFLKTSADGEEAGELFTSSGTAWFRFDFAAATTSSTDPTRPASFERHTTFEVATCQHF